MNPRKLWLACFCFIALCLSPLKADEISESASADPDFAKQFLREFKSGSSSAETIPASPQATLFDQNRDLADRIPFHLSDQLSVAPSLIILQDGPGAEDDTYLWRGSEAFRGSGVGYFVDDVPINLPGFRQQGGANLHWLMPELVDRVDASPGPFYAEVGDFGDLGEVRISTKKSFAGQTASVQGGMDNTIRAAAIASDRNSRFDPVVAGEFFTSNSVGPSPNQLKRYDVFGQATYDLTAHSSLSLGVSAYNSNWDTAGLIPERAYSESLTPFYGTLNGEQGGNEQRYAVRATYHTQISRGSSASVTAYATRAEQTSASDYTFFMVNPTSGGLTTDVEKIWQGGINAKYQFSEHGSGLTFDTLLGFQSSADWGNSALSPTVLTFDSNGIRAGVYGEQRIGWGRYFQTIAGARADFLGFSLTSNTGDLNKNAFELSPKIGLIITPTQHTEFFVNVGASFESNDPRAIALVPSTNVASRVTSYEIGVRTQVLSSRLHLSASGFLSTEEASTLYLADNATTTSIGAHYTEGIQAQARYDLLSWLLLDADSTFSRARLTDVSAPANLVPLAPTRVTTAGITLHHPSGFYGRLGIVDVGDRPASSDGFFTAQGFLRVDASMGYKSRDFQLSLAVVNLLNAQWKEIQTTGVSRLSGETSAASCPAGSRPVSSNGSFSGCEDMLFSAGTPLNLQANASVFF
jgi:hypothetical protein